ncbi:MAG: right-handed parallel beta-helix repeat-containing protein, partial [Planctomycetota bacterium]
MPHRQATAIAALALISAAALAGPLTPPAGAPAPTNKTLQEVEPRTPISSNGITIIIDEPGSYYLTGNVNAGASAISVQATDVTIDLNGFSLIGDDSGPDTGVSIGNVPNGAITIRNGTIREFGSRGVNYLFANARVILEDLHITDCGAEGVFIEGDAKITNCTANANGTTGFRVDTAAHISGCQSDLNGAHGFWIESGLITDSLARDNTLNGFNLGSIITNASSVVAVNCVSRSNNQEGFFSTDPVTLVNCHAVENGDFGFQLDNDASLEGCVARQNGNVGFLTGQTATLSRCIASE